MIGLANNHGIHFGYYQRLNQYGAKILEPYASTVLVVPADEAGMIAAHVKSCI